MNGEEESKEVTEEIVVTDLPEEAPASVVDEADSQKDKKDKKGKKGKKGKK